MASSAQKRRAKRDPTNTRIPSQVAAYDRLHQRHSSEMISRARPSTAESSIDALRPPGHIPARDGSRSDEYGFLWNKATPALPNLLSECRKGHALPLSLRPSH